MDWLARHLRRPASRQGKGNEDYIETKPPPMPPLHPQTAPSTGMARKSADMATTFEPPLARPRNKPPPRPARPDSGVIRDVNAWLDANMIKPGPPLMGGLPYWREGTTDCRSPSSDMQYAVPLIQMPDHERPTTSHSQHLKSFCRRAKKMQVRMPSLLRTKSQRVTVTQRKQANRRSTSMPLLSVPVETKTAPTPRTLARSSSLMQMADHSAAAATSSNRAGWIRIGRPQLLDAHQRHGSPASGRFGDPEASMERRVNAVFGHSPRVGDTTRPSTTVNRLPREDSMGNLSDAPTYFSGPPPPSYRSRAASVLTTSSFGCVDGMDSERRQVSQQRAVQRSRCMKGKFRKLAQKAHFMK